MLDFGVFPFISYILTCIYGFTRIIDNPNRPLVWSVGFIVGTEVIKLIFDSFIPTIKGGDAVSWFAGLIILYVILKLFLKSRELKKY